MCFSWLIFGMFFSFWRARSNIRSLINALAKDIMLKYMIFKIYDKIVLCVTLHKLALITHSNISDTNKFEK